MFSAQGSPRSKSKNEQFSNPVTRSLPRKYFASNLSVSMFKLSALHELCPPSPVTPHHLIAILVGVLVQDFMRGLFLRNDGVAGHAHGVHQHIVGHHGMLVRHRVVDVPQLRLTKRPCQYRELCHQCVMECKMSHSSGRTMSSVCHGVLNVPQFRQNSVLNVSWSVRCPTVQAEQCHQCVME